MISKTNVKLCSVWWFVFCFCNNNPKQSRYPAGMGTGGFFWWSLYRLDQNWKLSPMIGWLYGEEKLLHQIAMVAKYLDLNKPWSCKQYGRNNQKNDFPVDDCTQEQNGSPYFSLIAGQSKCCLCQERLLRSRNFVTILTWCHTSRLYYWQEVYLLSGLLILRKIVMLILEFILTSWVSIVNSLRWTPLDQNYVSISKKCPSYWEAGTSSRCPSYRGVW